MLTKPYAFPPSGVFEIAALRQRQRAPATARWVITVVFLFLAAAIFFAAVTPLKALIRAEGEITPDGRLIQVEHLTGGIVREVRAREGQRVAKGDVLAVLDDPALSAEIRQTGQALQQVRRGLHALEALMASLATTDTDAATITPIALESTAGSSVAAAHAAARLRVFQARHAITRDRIDQMDETIASLDVAADVALSRVNAQAERVRFLEALYAKGHVAEFRLRDANDRLEELRGEYAQAAVQLTRAVADQRDAQSEMSLQILSMREELLKETAELKRETHRLERLFLDLRQQQSALTLRAPRAGMIQSVAFPAAGEIIAPDSVIFELLPANSRLVAEIRLKPGDIGHVDIGARVDLKAQTYDFRRYGGVVGTVESLSPNRVAQPEGTEYFRARVALDSITVGKGSDRRLLRPGMEVAAEIQTRSRTILEYLLKPIDNALHTAMTER